MGPATLALVKLFYAKFKNASRTLALDYYNQCSAHDGEYHRYVIFLFMCMILVVDIDVDAVLYDSADKSFLFKPE